jgi:osmotically-inducible protein OsmY
MKYLLYGVVLFAGTVALGQMGPGQPQPGQPPQSTPPTFPQGQQSPRQQMPPDQRAPAPTPEATSSDQVQQQITQQFGTEPKLASANLRAEVDEASVVVTGTVTTVAQRDLALRIAQSHAADRNVVDKIKVKQQT